MPLPNSVLSLQFTRRLRGVCRTVRAQGVAVDEESVRDHEVSVSPGILLAKSTETGCQVIFIETYKTLLSESISGITWFKKPLISESEPMAPNSLMKTGFPEICVAF